MQIARQISENRGQVCEEESKEEQPLKGVVQVDALPNDLCPLGKCSS